MTVLLNHWIILELSVALIRLVPAGRVGNGDNDGKTETLIREQSIRRNGTYSSVFIVNAEIAVRQIAQSDWSTLENRLGMVIGQAFERSTLRRLGIDTGASLNTNKPIILFGHDNDSATEDGPNKTNEARPISGSPFRVQVLSIEGQLKGGIRVDFVVLLLDNPIPGNIVAGDLSFLSLSHISAVLQYPVTSIGSEYRSEQIEVSRWWIIAIIAGSGLLVALFGWGLLFIYFNTCGRPLIPTRPNHKFSNDITKVTEEDSAVDQNNISKDDNRQKSLIYDPGNTVARDTQGLFIPEPQEPFQDVPINIQKYVDKSMETITEEDRAEENLESGMEVASKKSEEVNDFVITEQPETVFKVQDRYKASAAAPKDPMPSNDEQKSAKDRSTMEISSKWTPYLAGDQVAAILANQPIFLMNKAGHYPCPLPTTERGVLEMSFQDR